MLLDKPPGALKTASYRPRAAYVLGRRVGGCVDDEKHLNRIGGACNYNPSYKYWFFGELVTRPERIRSVAYYSLK